MTQPRGRLAPLAAAVLIALLAGCGSHGAPPPAPVPADNQPPVPAPAPAASSTAPADPGAQLAEPPTGISGSASAPRRLTAVAGSGALLAAAGDRGQAAEPPT